MTNKQALKIAELLKTGKQYKQGHYQYGYEYFWFVESSNTFIYNKNINKKHPALNRDA